MPAARSDAALVTDVHRTNDYHELPATEKQIGYARALLGESEHDFADEARALAQRSGVVLPWDVQQDRKSLSAWIEEKRNATDQGRFSSYPSSKQVAFAERIARHKQRQVPQECFRDRTMMSKWIDSNR